MEPNANRWILLEDLSEYSAENRELIEGTWHEGRIQMGEDATREASKNILKSMALQMEHSRADNDISNVFILQLLRLPARGSGQWLEGEPKDQILVDGIRNVHLDPPERWTMLCTNLRTNEKGLLPGKSFVFVGVNEMCDCGQNGGCGCVYEDLASSLVSFLPCLS